jgi:alpha-beta hydrolase superfamily lysophospholipase
LGGLIVLDYGLHDRDGLRGIISSGPALARGEGISPLLEFAAKVLSRVAPKLEMKTGLDAAGLSRNPAVVQAYRDDPLVHGLASPRLGAEISQTMEVTQAHADEWPADLPLLIVHGAADPICPASASARFFANVSARDKTRYEYPGFLHESFNEVGREKVLADVQGWIEART